MRVTRLVLLLYLFLYRLIIYLVIASTSLSPSCLRSLMSRSPTPATPSEQADTLLSAPRQRRVPGDGPDTRLISRPATDFLACLAVTDYRDSPSNLSRYEFTV